MILKWYPPQFEIFHSRLAFIHPGLTLVNDDLGGERDDNCWVYRTSEWHENKPNKSLVESTCHWVDGRSFTGYTYFWDEFSQGKPVESWLQLHRKFTLGQ